MPAAFLEHVLGVDFFTNMAETSNVNDVAKSPPAEIDRAEPYAPSERNWKPTNGEEMEAFIDINQVMGSKDMPEYKDHWINDPVLNDPYISGIMSRSVLCREPSCRPQDGWLRSRTGTRQLGRQRAVIGKQDGLMPVRGRAA